MPAFCPSPDFAVREEDGALDVRLFLSPLVWFGIGIVPGLLHPSLDFVLTWPYQSSCFGAEGVAFCVPAQDSWYAEFVLAT